MLGRFTASRPGCSSTGRGFRVPTRIFVVLFEFGPRGEQIAAKAFASASRIFSGRRRDAVEAYVQHLVVAALARALAQRQARSDPSVRCQAVNRERSMGARRVSGVRGVSGIES